MHTADLKLHCCYPWESSYDLWTSQTNGVGEGAGKRQGRGSVNEGAVCNLTIRTFSMEFLGHCVDIQ